MAGSNIKAAANCSFSSDRQGLGLQRLDSIGGRGGGAGGGGVVERHI